MFRDFRFALYYTEREADRALAYIVFSRMSAVSVLGLFSC
jgi:hypothetical protein